MKKLLVLAACASAFVGCDFVSTGSGGPAVPVSSLRLTNIPQGLEEDGTPQDLLVEVQDITGRNYFRSEQLTDVATDSLTFDADFELEGVGRSLYVVVYDYDGPTDFDLVAISEEFTGEALNESEEAVVTVGSESGMQAELEIER